MGFLSDDIDTFYLEANLTGDAAEELKKAEKWRKHLENQGFRVEFEPHYQNGKPELVPVKMIECQKCGTMYSANNGLCPCCQ